MSDARFNIRILSFLTIGILSLGAVSCSDDIAELTEGAGRSISFEVAERVYLSRGADDTSSLPTLALKGDRPLYLIPEVSRTVETALRASRGEAVTRSTIATFGAYASLNSSSATAFYMDNVEITRDNSWSPLRQYLWPGDGTLHVNAYSPYCETPSGEGGEGITSLPAFGSSVLTYTVPTDVTAQTDLLWATPRDASASPCLMTFNHALSAVRFVTGDDMTPCTVKSITISGIYGSGSLDIDSGEWSDMQSVSSYTADLDVNLSAPEGETAVASGTAVTDSTHTFMLLPQSLGSDASVTLVIDIDGTEYSFTASLDGQTWAAGNTYTYHLSANPSVDRFILSVVSPLQFNYTGGTKSFSVTSTHETTSGGSLSTEQIPWIAEYVDADGNVIDTPTWIESFPLSGEGSVDCEAVTRMVEPDFVQMSDMTRRLRANSTVGSTDAPYNLSNSTGAEAVENTANCYVINAPGSYSIPLVYGNAIKNGADNTAAYVPTRTNAPFVNHLGNRIKHPYIYDNDGCSDIKDAALVWEGQLNVVRDVRLSDDGKSLLFDIPASSIRQGNAVVGIRDASGNYMWSWQLWITPYVPGDDVYTMSYNNSTFTMLPYNLGRVFGGDEIDYPSSNVLVRFTQRPADGSEGKSVTVSVGQTGKHILTPDCHSFYQWGRKDPMISGIKQWYYADHTEITQIETRTIDIASGTIGTEHEADLVKAPQVFWILPMSGNPTFKFTNNWNLGSGTRRVKTVYDPSPVGYMVPGNEIMAFRDISDSNLSFRPYAGESDPATFVFSDIAGVSEMTFPALGYRSGKSGAETVTSNGANMTELWSSHANTHEAVALVLVNADPITHKLPDEARLEAFAIRPINE